MRLQRLDRLVRPALAQPPKELCTRVVHGYSMAAPIHASERKTIEVRRDLRPYSAQIDVGGTVVVDDPAFRAVVTSSSFTFPIAAPTAVLPTTVMDPMHIEEVHVGSLAFVPAGTTHTEAHGCPNGIS